MYELEDINPQITTYDVAIVLGANDIVNPDTQSQPSSPIYGMPVLEVASRGLIEGCFGAFFVANTLLWTRTNAIGGLQETCAYSLTNNCFS